MDQLENSQNSSRIVEKHCRRMISPTRIQNFKNTPSKFRYFLSEKRVRGNKGDREQSVLRARSLNSNLSRRTKSYKWWTRCNSWKTFEMISINYSIFQIFAFKISKLLVFFHQKKRYVAPKQIENWVSCD